MTSPQEESGDVHAALSALQRARRRSPPAVTSSTVVGNTAERCRPPASQPRRPRRCATSSATSLRVAARPRAAALAAPLLVRAALPAPRQLRHCALPHVAAAPRRRRDNYVIVRHHTRRPAGAAKTTSLHVGATTSAATTHRSSLHVNLQKSPTAPATFFN